MARSFGFGLLPTLVRSWLLAISACVALLAFPRGVRAQAPAVNADAETRAPVLAVLILDTPGTEWAARVRGQLSDLPALVHTAPLPEGGPDARALRALSRRFSADLIAWIMPEGGSVELGDPGAIEAPRSTYVALWFSSTERLYARVVAGAWSGLSAADRSGAVELAALGVRSAVRSVILDPSLPPAPSPAEPRSSEYSSIPESPAAPPPVTTSSPDVGAEPSAPAPADSPRETDGDIAAERSASSALDAPNADAPSEVAGAGEARADTAPVSTAERVDVEQELDAPYELPSADEVPWNVQVTAEGGAGWQYLGPGTASTLGLHAAAGVAVEGWTFAVFGQRGLESGLRVGPTRFDVRRSGLGVEVRRELMVHGAFSLGPLARAGAVWFERGSAEAQPDTDPTRPVTHRTFSAGLGASGQWYFASWAGASLRALLNWQASTPGFAITRTSDGSIIAETTNSWLQPSIDAGFFLRW